MLLGGALTQVRLERPGAGALALLPTAVERCYEGLVSTSVNIVKAAGLASTIAVPEAISAVSTIIAEGADAATMMTRCSHSISSSCWSSSACCAPPGERSRGRDSRHPLGLAPLSRRRFRRQPHRRRPGDDRGHRPGALLGRGRDSRLVLLRAPAWALTSLCRNVPSFVLMFYVALVLPPEIAWDDTVVSVPLWIKAALALTIPVIGFASDQGLALRRQRRAGIAGADATYLTAWLQYFLIVLMATATASVIGADEIVGRANHVIAPDNRVEFLIATYLYVSAWFLAFGLVLTRTLAWIARNRHTEPPLPAARKAA